jgi:hypothetical protein
MTVSTHQLALLDLGEDQGSVVTLKHRTDVVDLGRSRKMVPGHCRRMEDAPAVRTRLGALQRRVPRHKLLVLASLLEEASRT